jgi:EAL domain-containing protein (putative c-di-GMP-specific phosphodiesterase class I)/GGDEF domain-containing protein
MAAPRETPGTTTLLIVRHVRRRAGDAGVDAVLRRAALEHDLSALVDETQWFAYEDKIRLFDAASDVLEDPDVGRHVGESLLDGEAGGLVPVLRSLGSPASVFRALMDASASFCPIGDMDAVEVREQDARIRYHLHPEFAPNHHDCGYTAGLLTQVPVLFGLAPATVEHPTCQVRWDDACLYHLRWSSTPRARRPMIGRRARRDLVRGLSARFWELEAATLDLVTDGDPGQVLATIAERAADAVGASAHLLVLADPDGTAPDVIRHRFVGGGGALVDQALHSVVDDADPLRIVAELVSDRRRYGHLVMLFEEGHEPIPEERTIVKTYARHAATALDAAASISGARLREETASVLLRLARSLADLTTVDDVTTRIAELVPAMTGAPQAAVLLWERASRSLQVRASAGVPEHLRAEVDALTIPLEEAELDVPSAIADGPLLRAPAGARGVLADLMDRHGEAWLALVPVRVRGRLRGLITAGWLEAGAITAQSAVEERLAGIADQAATALENAMLLEQIRHQALHDSLTGLPNQSLFSDRVGNEITRAKRNRARVALCVLDLDRFKTVNDSLGHRAGDELLVQVADRLQRVMRAPDTIARMGGDEFTLLLPDVVDGGEAVVAERILEAFEHLLRCADVAMYRAKERGRNGWVTYASGMAERAHDRLTLETDLYRAVQRRELRIAYQPIASLAQGRVVATEALVRWAHPTLGLLVPDEFLPIAEDLGLMAEIDGWVLRQACLQLGAATAGGTGPGRVAVNVSPRTLYHPALERLVSEALAAGGIEPDRLVVEVGEQISADRSDALGDALQTLRNAGVRISLDDFGRGHSALSQLARLPIDQIKVDASFLADVDDVDEHAPVTEAIVAMGHGLGLEVVAEGVETDVQRAFAQRVGFDLVQGWIIGRPAVALDDYDDDDGARSRTA